MFVLFSVGGLLGFVCLFLCGLVCLFYFRLGNELNPLIRQQEEAQSLQK